MTAGLWIVVVNYRSHALVDENFSALDIDQDIIGGLVLVDNFSSLEEQAAAADLCERLGWEFVPRSTNDGFATACNEGIWAAHRRGASSVLLVNPDAQVSPELVDGVGRQLAHEPTTLISPLVVTSEGTPYFRGARVDLRDGHMRRWTGLEESRQPDYLDASWPDRPWLTGACLGFTVALWDMAGGLDERYFLYWEDVDFSQRCVKAGARLCLRSDLVAVHDEGGTHGEQGSRARSTTYYYYNCRNRLVYAASHLSRAEGWRWVWSTPRESWQILLRGGRRQLLQSPAPLVATLRGSFAGLLHVLPWLVSGQRSLGRG